MRRRKFSREFKLEAVRLVKDRGVSVAQAARDLDLHVNVLRKWTREAISDPQHAFPGHGQMKPEQLEIDRLRKEVAKLKAERDILKNRPRPAARLCAVETACAIFGFGGELPMAYWRYLTPLKNVAHGPMRT
jgi:transposase